MNDVLPRYMNYQQTMKYINIGSYNTLYKLINKGLRVTVVDGIKRIDQKDVDKFMQEHSI